MELQKESTAPREVAGRRHGKWYDDACGTAFAMELVGERWSLLIVRELMFGGRRFSDIRASLPGISAKVLTERLESLERTGILLRRKVPPPAAVQVYELTPWGLAADEAIMTLGRWAARSPDHDPTLPLSAASLGLSFRTMFDAGRAAGLDLTGTLRIGAEPFHVAVRNGELAIGRGDAAAPGFVLSAPAASPIAAAVYGKVPFADLAPAGLALAGSEAAALAFVDCFHLPEKFARPG
jgi:DNA-binding HxlR family transcriptional regulator